MMKSIILKSVYAGLGMAGAGKEKMEQLTRQLAEKADVNAKDGQKIARDLRARFDKAINALQKRIEADVKKTADILHASVQADARKFSAKSKPTAKANRPKRAGRKSSNQAPTP